MEYGAVPYETAVTERGAELMESRMSTTAEIHHTPINPPPSPSSDLEKSGVRCKN